MKQPTTYKPYPPYHILNDSYGSVNISLVMGEDGTPRLPPSGLTEEERLVEEGKPVTLK